MYPKWNSRRCEISSQSEKFSRYKYKKYAKRMISWSEFHFAQKESVTRKQSKIHVGVNLSLPK